MERHHDVEIVGQGRRNPVAGPDPEVVEGAGGLVGPGVELGVRRPALSGDQRQPGWVVCQGGVEDIEHAGRHHRGRTAHRVGTGASGRSLTAGKTGGAVRQSGIPSAGSAAGYFDSWISAQWEWLSWCSVKQALSEL